MKRRDNTKPEPKPAWPFKRIPKSMSKPELTKLYELLGKYQKSIRETEPMASSVVELIRIWITWKKAGIK